MFEKPSALANQVFTSCVTVTLSCVVTDCCAAVTVATVPEKPFVAATVCAVLIAVAGSPGR